MCCMALGFCGRSHCFSGGWWMLSKYSIYIDKVNLNRIDARQQMVINVRALLTMVVDFIVQILINRIMVIRGYSSLNLNHHTIKPI